MAAVFILVTGAYTTMSAERKAGTEIAVSTMFTANMVIQRDMRVPIWGTAQPGEKVVIDGADKLREGASVSLPTASNQSPAGQSPATGPTQPDPAAGQPGQRQPGAAGAPGNGGHRHHNGQGQPGEGRSGTSPQP